MKDNNPTLDDYTSIKTYEDACEVLGIKPMWSAWYHTEGDSVEYETNMTPLHIEALMKL